MIAPSPPVSVRLLRDDVLIRLQRRVGLAPSDGLGGRRRAVALAAIAWLPIAAWAAWTERVAGAGALDAYGIAVRLLVAVPLMIVAESIALRNAVRVAPHCADLGVFHGDGATLRGIAADLIRLRDGAHQWVVAAGAAFGMFAGWRGFTGEADGTSTDGPSGFGPAWYLWVGRPIFTACVATWLWRAAMIGIALRRLSRAGFAPVVTHPDRAGGFSFLARATAPFGLVAFALSAVVGTTWAYEILVRGADIGDYGVLMAMTVAIPTVAFLSPLLVLAGPMARARREALLRYGALASRYGHAVHRRWIVGERVDDPVLEAPEIGAAADASALYESVLRMRPVPIDVASVLSIAVPAALPMFALLVTQVPLATIAKGIAGALL